MKKGIYLFSQYSYHKGVEETGLLEDAEKVLQTLATKQQLLNLYKEAKLDPDLVRILRLYFNLANERTPDESPSPEGLEYLTTLCLEIYHLLTSSSEKVNELLLFRIFVRLNFNKDQIIDYYTHKLDKLIEDLPKNRDLIEGYLIECDYPAKKNTAFTSKNHSLGREIKGHLEVAMNQHDRKLSDYNSYPPAGLFRTNVSLALTMYFFKLLINVGIFEIIGSHTDFWKALSKLMRGKNGKRYDHKVIKAKFSSKDTKDMERATTYTSLITTQITFDMDVSNKGRIN